eukprot:CAMPEP_0198241820 /NCGR_PEP_ID=MMETSP1446-20131203/6511_1 /TAXON_ID=1461542 ORGANISM="Unidentified sp, Strain CCMP2111" /NCGR_SAMPLE_ID=MMETSP1446 /ASSEMBLY_ACC=CAM_ASM_001112 /LENGTH=897 /DNA_ID=CAMNT_0043924697 /DNA_START=1 /DNA_END=2694 /DNA_ORIENTATION=+
MQRAGVHAFKAEEFKTCETSSFCKRLRNTNPAERLSLDPESLRLDSAGTLHGKVKIMQPLQEAKENATVYVHDALDFEMRAYGSGILRMKMSEAGRFEVPLVIVPELQKHQIPLMRTMVNKDEERFGFGDSEVRIKFASFEMEVWRPHDRLPVMTFNRNNLFHFERQIDTSVETQDWSETFRSHKDTCKKGPNAMSFDVSFPGVDHVYGIPERATSLSLGVTRTSDGKETFLEEPYRLYNLDVFEYLHEHPFGLYGSIPFLTAHRAGSTSGVFWLNSAEMYVDIWKPSQHKDDGTHSQWISESGIVDVFFFVGPSPADVSEQYATVTGATRMPQLFSLGYHQCRWNYKDEADVRGVDSKLDEHSIPCDVVWLDIEHTDGKRYMTWDKPHFPDPKVMQEDLARKGRKMVAIIDPHIKKDEKYSLYKEATQLGYLVKKHDGKVFDGWCWPGSSVYLDMLNPEARKWWATLFTPQKYQGSTESLYVWNDMNEPSVFNGPEVTMHKDNLHHGGVEHRDVHNINGYLYHLATAEGLIHRGEVSANMHSDRPFVLSRAFFAGSQRVGPIWTGDNTASWDQLRVSVPMCLSIGISGLTFSGADVGGFFGNPDEELMTRWYQLGAFYPFFRAHAHIDTKRREPWLFGEEATRRIRNAIQLRYSLLPYIYSAFAEASERGTPVMRPLWFEFPDEEKTFAKQDSFMLGSAILVSPVLEQSTQNPRGTVDVYLPGDGLWYDLHDGTVYDAKKIRNSLTAKVSLETIPIYLRGGSVLLRKMRPRRNTAAMEGDPYTLVVVLDRDLGARGQAYVDDGQSLQYESDKMFMKTHFSYENGELRCKVQYKNVDLPNSSIERIVVMGAPQKITQAKVSDAQGHQTVNVVYTASNIIVIGKPPVAIDRDWSLTLH